MKLVIRGLNKNYGAKVALQDFHAVFENGIYGILGPNGAGKSTLMNILTDNLLRDSGRILCNETEITKMKAQYRKIMGYMPQQQQLYDSFTVNHFISYMGTLRGMDKRNQEAHGGTSSTFEFKRAEKKEDKRTVRRDETEGSPCAGSWMIHRF